MTRSIMLVAAAGWLCAQRPRRRCRELADTGRGRQPRSRTSTPPPDGRVLLSWIDRLAGRALMPCASPSVQGDGWSAPRVDRRGLRTGSSTGPTFLRSIALPDGLARGALAREESVCALRVRRPHRAFDRRRRALERAARPAPGRHGDGARVRVAVRHRRRPARGRLARRTQHPTRIRRARACRRRDDAALCGNRPRPRACTTKYCSTPACATAARPPRR